MDDLFFTEVLPSLLTGGKNFCRCAKKLLALSIFFLLVEMECCGEAATSLPDSSYERLEELHAKFSLIHGNQKHELPEQLLVATYLPADAKVLELGADVGRNSCVIATILGDSRNLVSVESRKEALPCLAMNREHNSFHFHIEPAAISKVPLVQKGWITIPSEVDLPGYTRVDTITYGELRLKYGIDFDTLVADCEGALFYILRDEPSFLEGIRLIFIENDFQCAEHCTFVIDSFREKGFELIHNEGAAYWYDNSFYQVWARHKPG